MRLCPVFSPAPGSQNILHGAHLCSSGGLVGEVGTVPCMAPPSCSRPLRPPRLPWSLALFGGGGVEEDRILSAISCHSLARVSLKFLFTHQPRGSGMSEMTGAGNLCPCPQHKLDISRQAACRTPRDTSAAMALGRPPVREQGEWPGPRSPRLAWGQRFVWATSRPAAPRAPVGLIVKLFKHCSNVWTECASLPSFQPTTFPCVGVTLPRPFHGFGERMRECPHGRLQNTDVGSRQTHYLGCCPVCLLSRAFIPLPGCMVLQGVAVP